MCSMKTFTLLDANEHLDMLAANPDFAGEVAALRALVADGLSAGEIDFMMRGNLPFNLIEVLVEAHRATAVEPVIAA
jgi:hypothetical protein